VRGMVKIVSVRVPDDVSEEDIIRWVLEGLARRMAKRLALKYLEEGVDIDLEEAVKSFEETRSEVWRELEKEYRRMGIL
jgi:reverse gyrase